MSTRLTVVGMSLRTPCGVYDHAKALGDETDGETTRDEMRWLTRQSTSLRGAWQEVDRWLERLALDLRSAAPDIIVLHYSVFSYSHRGLPIFVPRVIATLRDAGVPVVVVLHEFAFPWRHHGARGKLWAISQRIALIPVMRAASAVLVTTDQRAQWLASRRWLPQRLTATAAVFSNLPPPIPSEQKRDRRPTIGIFGYSYGAAVTSLVMDAFALMREQGSDAALSLLGAPGERSEAGVVWRRAATLRQIDDRLSFTGVLAPQALSDALARCDVVIFGDPRGPSARKGTLAAALAAGVAVVAVDGRDTWQELVRCDALRIVPPESNALATAVLGLLSDERARVSLAERGARFARDRMSLANAVIAIATLIDKSRRSKPSDN